MEAGEGTASHQPWLGHRPSDRVPQPTATTIFPASAVSSLPLPPVAHPCALVTVPRAPSRASWGEGVTLITLGRERSGGQREEPLAAPPSPPRVSLRARRQRRRPAPAYSSSAAAATTSSSSHPHRARPRAGACYGERLALARVCDGIPGRARNPLPAPPPPSRAPALLHARPRARSHVSLFGVQGG